LCGQTNKTSIIVEKLLQTAVWFLGAFLKIYLGALHGKFMKVSRSVYVSALPCAIGTNLVYSSRRTKNRSTGRADLGLLQEQNTEFKK